MSRGLPLQLVWTRGESLPAAESGRLRLSISSSWSRWDSGVEEKQQACFDLHCWQLSSELWYLAQGFRAPLTVWMGSWGWLQGWREGGLKLCRVLSSIPGLYPRDVGSTHWLCERLFPDMARYSLGTPGRTSDTKLSQTGLFNNAFM